MTYDPTQVAASIIMDGIDLRQAFGFEPLEPAGRESLNLDRRTWKLPLSHGEKTQGGVYRPRTIAVRGWMPKANVGAFTRFLFIDTAKPGSSTRTRSVVFQDRKDESYIFDTVESFAERERTQRWMTTLYVDVEFTINVLNVFARRSGASHYMLYGPWLYNGTAEGASATNPAFLQVYPQFPQATARTAEDLVVRVGKATTPSLISLKTGPITNFNEGLKMIGNDGGSIDGDMYAPTEILTNPDFELDAMTGWTTFGSHTIAPEVVGSIYDLGYNYTHRIPTGSTLMHAQPSASNSGIYQDFATTAAKQYTVRCEIFFINNPGGPGTNSLRFGKAGTDEGLVEVVMTGWTDRVWHFIEFTMESESTENYRVKLNMKNGSIYYVNKVSVVESKIGNGSFEGTFTAGLASGWETNMTPTEETSIIHSSGSSTARKAQRLSGGTNNYIRPTADITTADNKVYYLSGWCYRVSGGGNLRIRNSVSGAETCCSDEIELETSAWVRFSCFFDTFDSKSTNDGNALRPNFVLSAAATVIILDDIALHELDVTTNVHYEPGPYGKRVQVPVGQVIAFQDNAGADSMFINALVFTMAFHLLPGHLLASSSATHYNQDMSPMVARASRKYGQDTALRWDRNKISTILTEDGNSGTPAWYKATGDAEAQSDGWNSWLGGNRGTRGCVVKYDGNQTQETGYELKLFLERCIPEGATTNPTTLKKAIVPESSTVVPTLWPLLNSYDVLLLGDAGHWDAFWCYQYPKNDIMCARECVSQGVPAHDNKVFTYNANIGAGQELIIDVERGTVELNDGAGTIANAFANVIGSLPELAGDAPCLMVDVDVNGLQIIAKGNS